MISLIAPRASQRRLVLSLCLGLGLAYPATAQTPLLPTRNTIEEAPVFNEAQLRFKIRALLAKYPFVSVEPRLMYEMSPRPRGNVALSKSAEDRLKNMEGNLAAFDPRVMSLVALHSREVRSFVQKDGFGSGRMGPIVSLRYLALPPAESIPFASSPLRGDIGALVKLPDQLPEGGGNGLPSVQGLSEMHLQGVESFAHPSKLGYAMSRKAVSGFQSHHFSSMPQHATLSPVPNERWVITRLELVSLLKHGKPAVYLSDSLPRMNELRTARVRTVTGFEAKALRTLAAGEDVVVNAHEKQIQMVGSIRAAKQCLKCHSAERGELLGAFTYHLQRDENPPRK